MLLKYLISILPLFCFTNRPQRAKMRFWAKGKQGEKKTARVKPTLQSEVSSLSAGSDVTSANPFSDGKNGQRMGLHNFCY